MPLIGGCVCCGGEYDMTMISEFVSLHCESKEPLCGECWDKMENLLGRIRCTQVRQDRAPCVREEVPFWCNHIVPPQR